MSWLERRFGVRAAGSTVRREVVAGLVTFSTLSYVLFVQPAVLAQAGMEPRGVLFATCVASAAACFLMAWWANHPFALAPAMGHNFYFAFTVCGTMGFAWQEALAANLLAGALFLLLIPTGLRERVMEAVPGGLRGGIAAGIGLLIALIGLEWGELVVDHPATYVTLGDLSRPVPLLTLFGLAVTAALLARGVPGAILLGLAAAAGAGWGATLFFDLDPPVVRSGSFGGELPSPAGTAFHLDFAGLFARPATDWLTVLAVFFLLDLFDSIGSLLGLGRQAGLLEGGRLPRARGALAADAAGTVAGAALGTSTITSYVESAAGIASGGRTGLVAAVVGLCFLAALVLAPAIEVVGAGVVVATEPVVVTRYPLLAPALILVGALMFGALRDVDWDDRVEAVPAFLTAVVIPLTFSITDGLAWGFVAYSLLCLVTRRRAPALVHVLASLFLLRYLLLG